MKQSLIAALMILAACSQATPPAAEAPAEAAPLGLMEQAQALPVEQRPVFAWQQLHQRTDLQPPCTSIRASEARGIIPANVAPDSIYAGHAGSLVFAIQCGPQLTTATNDPREHWLVILQPGATDATILNCAEEGSGRDRCLGPIPQAAATP